MNSRYKNSEKMLAQALKTIPLGTQTFSKSKVHYPYGASPFFIQKGKGSKVWDIDGNKYIDFVSSLASILLGYNDPDIIRAVKKQLKNGPIFSLPHPIENQVAKKIIALIPCAEMVRFGKNGSDATTGAIRLARAYTKREHVAVCGYHGWHDWYIGSTSRNLGIPKSTINLTHAFMYNDITSLEKIFDKYPDQIAAVIMEPTNITPPKKGFLESVKKITHKNNSLLIFDEIVTGFRLSLGGAQELFGVTPDLATFGKAIANGYPLSVLTGKAKIMKLLEEVFFSFTFGGETLSLAAALATINKIQKERVLDKIKKRGEKLVLDLKKLITKYNLEHIFKISGQPCWSFLNIKETKEYSSLEIKTFLMQEMLKRGILMLGTHNITFSHTDKDINYLLKVYEEVLCLIKKTIEQNSLKQQLDCKTLKSLFKIR
jgi:glutamate-1-semialdehyde 2,1-aminomutase